MQMSDKFDLKPENYLGANKILQHSLVFYLISTRLEYYINKIFVTRVYTERFDHT